MKQIADRIPEDSATASPPLTPIDRELFRDIEVMVEARLGNAHTTIGALMDLKSGAIVTLDTGIADPIELYVNDALVARGEIVAVGDSLGIRIVEVAKP